MFSIYFNYYMAITTSPGSPSDNEYALYVEDFNDRYCKKL